MNQRLIAAIAVFLSMLCIAMLFVESPHDRKGFYWMFLDGVLLGSFLPLGLLSKRYVEDSSGGIWLTVLILVSPLVLISIGAIRFGVEKAMWGWEYAINAITFTLLSGGLWLTAIWLWRRKRGSE